MAEATYIHGTTTNEQDRLALLNSITNGPFLDFLQLRDRDHVLEVGSGLGILAGEAARRIPAGRVTGVEYSEQQLAAARGAAPNLRLMQGDAHSLPFENDKFDVVYCRYLLEHLADPPKALAEMRRVLKPGGRLLVQENDIFMCRFDPDCPTFYMVWERFVELQARLGGDGLIGRRLFGLLKRAGFKDIELSLQPEIHWAGKPTFEGWVINIIGNIEGAKQALVESGLATGDEVDAAASELRSLMERDDSSALFHWNRATGVK
jgi:SAM-dependent methyltransferase